MGLFDRILRKSLPSRSEGPLDVILPRTEHVEGIGADYERQLKDGYAANPYVARCVDLRATAIATLRPVVMDAQGAELPNHPLNGLFRKPNPRMSWRDLIYQAEADLAISGNAFLWLIPTISGISEIWPVPMSRITPYTSSDLFHPVTSWGVNLGSGQKLVSPADMIHVHGVLDAEGVLGISPLTVSGMSITQQTQAREWNTALMRNGGKPSGTLESDQPLSEADMDDVEASLRRQHSGTRNAGRWMILPYGLKANVQGFSARDMDYTAGSTMLAREISISLGVPPELVGDSANKTYANAAEANKEFASHTIKPLADQLYNIITRKFEPWYPGIRIGYDEQQIDGLRGDESTIIAALTSCDFLTTNEKRERLSYPAVQGGDEILTAMGKVPLEEVSTPVDQLVPTDGS